MLSKEPIKADGTDDTLKIIAKENPGGYFKELDLQINC
jgi:hypothetical protein